MNKPIFYFSYSEDSLSFCDKTVYPISPILLPLGRLPRLGFVVRKLSDIRQTCVGDFTELNYSVKLMGIPEEDVVSELYRIMVNQYLSRTKDQFSTVKVAHERGKYLYALREFYKTTPPMDLFYQLYQNLADDTLLMTEQESLDFENSCGFRQCFVCGTINWQSSEEDAMKHCDHCQASISDIPLSCMKTFTIDRKAV